MRPRTPWTGRSWRPDAYRRAATQHVAQILQGARPADLPVPRPDKYRLVVNRRTARMLGIAIPQSLLGQADEILP